MHTLVSAAPLKLERSAFIATQLPFAQTIRQRWPLLVAGPIGW
ncbi:protein tyrosine phosphatase [Paraburkholderia sp. EB58]